MTHNTCIYDMLLCVCFFVCLFRGGEGIFSFAEITKEEISSIK